MQFGWGQQVQNTMQFQPFLPNCHAQTLIFNSKCQQLSSSDTIYVSFIHSLTALKYCCDPLSVLFFPRDQCVGLHQSIRPNKIDSMFYLSSRVQFGPNSGKKHTKLFFRFFVIGLTTTSSCFIFKLCVVFSRTRIAFPKKSEVKHRIYFMRPQHRPLKPSTLLELSIKMTFDLETRSFDVGSQLLLDDCSELIQWEQGANLEMDGEPSGSCGPERASSHPGLANDSLICLNSSKLQVRIVLSMSLD